MLNNSFFKKTTLLALIVQLFVYPSITFADKSIDYEMIKEMEYTGMDDYLIRYFQTFDTESPYCLGYLDSLAYKKERDDYLYPSLRTIHQTKPLCHLYDKEVATGYTDAHVEKVEFEEDLVRLHVSYFYLRKFGEYKTECTVKVKDGEFGELECEEGVREDT